MDLTTAIALVRQSVVAIFRIHMTKPETFKKGKPHPAQFALSWGSGFCVVSDRFVVTAFHVFNGGQPRDPTDRFLAFVVPGNGDPAFTFPVTGFPLERPDLDLAILELGPSETAGVTLPALPVSSGHQPDGTRVITVGFPAPEIHSVTLDPQGNYRGGAFFLKSHANEGIVSAQYFLNKTLAYELNVGWHHGESGGPVVRVGERPAAFTIMQQYRNIQTPHGMVAGPHRGFSLSTIAQELAQLGATIL